MEDALRTRRLTEKHDARRNQFLVAAAAVWAANLLDISLIVKTKDGTKESFSLRICCEAKDHIGVTAHCRF
jgi:hypothetical protein